MITDYYQRLKQFGLLPELVIVVGFASLVVACIGLCALNYSSHHALDIYGASCSIFTLMLLLGIPENWYKSDQFVAGGLLMDIIYFSLLFILIILVVFAFTFGQYLRRQEFDIIPGQVNGGDGSPLPLSQHSFHVQHYNHHQAPLARQNASLASISFGAHHQAQLAAAAVAAANEYSSCDGSSPLCTCNSGQQHDDVLMSSVSVPAAVAIANQQQRATSNQQQQQVNHFVGAEAVPTTTTNNKEELLTLRQQAPPTNTTSMMMKLCQHKDCTCTTHKHRRCCHLFDHHQKLQFVPQFAYSQDNNNNSVGANAPCDCGSLASTLAPNQLSTNRQLINSKTEKYGQSSLSLSSSPPPPLVHEGFYHTLSSGGGGGLVRAKSFSRPLLDEGSDDDDEHDDREQKQQQQREKFSDSPINLNKMRRSTSNLYPGPKTTRDDSSIHYGHRHQSLSATHSTTDWVPQQEVPIASSNNNNNNGQAPTNGGGGGGISSKAQLINPSSSQFTQSAPPPHPTSTTTPSSILGSRCRCYLDSAASLAVAAAARFNQTMSIPVAPFVNGRLTNSSSGQQQQQQEFRSSKRHHNLEHYYHHKHHNHHHQHYHHQYQQQQPLLRYHHNQTSSYPMNPPPGTGINSTSTYAINCNARGKSTANNRNITGPNKRCSKGSSSVVAMTAAAAAAALFGGMTDTSALMMKPDDGIGDDGLFTGLGETDETLLMDSGERNCTDFNNNHDVAMLDSLRAAQTGLSLW